MPWPVPTRTSAWETIGELQALQNLYPGLVCSKLG